MTEDTKKKIKSDIRKYETLMEFSSTDNLVYGKIASFLKEVLRKRKINIQKKRRLLWIFYY